MHIDELLTMATERKASDIHLTVGTPPIFRIDGDLIRVNIMDKLLPDDTEKYAKAIMNDHLQKQFDDKGEVDFSYAVKNLGRFRVNVYQQRGSYAVALRLIPIEIPTIDELGLPQVMKDIASKKRGLVLVTGPTGSGKSTSLASMLNHINNNRSEHIITIEDPIEYLHTHKNSIINQREVGQDSNNYPNALRAALRQDPDIILIGEMRDLETISIAITAAETGHLVFATLHTVNAVSSIERIIDVFPPFQQEQVKVQLANVLEGVISQQLLSRANQRGRIAACEVMIPNSAIRNNIRDGKTHQILSFLQTGRGEGMISMDASLMELYKSNYITKEDALKYAMDRKRMRTLI